MSILLIAKNRDMNPWKDSLLEIDEHLDIEVWPRVENKDRVTFAVSWNHPFNVLDGYQHLNVVQSIGAGVDHILNDPSIKDSVSIARMMIPSLKTQMAEYVLNAVQNYRFHTSRYVDQKREGFWSKHDPIPKTNCVIGILGLGEIGREVATHLTEHQFEVLGWSRSKKQLLNIETFGADDLHLFLNKTNILVCLLPLTSSTKGILELDLFKELKNPAYLINAARGAHLVEEDLIYAMDTGVLEGACLDVFEEEPLPNNHLFWNRPKIMITPHIASITDPIEASKIIVENYKRSLSGMELRFAVDKEMGY